jgi:hypothetical protein
MSDVDLNELDPGIRLTVRLLRALGFETTDSGDGESKAEAIRDGEALDMPHVFMRVAPERMVEDADHLALVLSSRMLSLELPVGSIEVSYSPIDRSAILALYGIDDIALAEAGIDPERIAEVERTCAAVHEFMRGPRAPTKGEP